MGANHFSPCNLRTRFSGCKVGHDDYGFLGRLGVRLGFVYLVGLVSVFPAKRSDEDGSGLALLLGGEVECSLILRDVNGSFKSQAKKLKLFSPPFYFE